MSKEWNGFDSLDLSGISEEGGRATLKPGNYICVVTDVEIKTAVSGGKYIEAVLTDPSCGQHVIDRITVWNKNEKATEIGVARLKSLLSYGGHPTPDKPGQLTSLKGLKVGVRVEAGDDWVDKKTGETRPGGGKPRNNGAYFSPGSNVPLGEQAPAPAGAATQRGAQDKVPRAAGLDDEIPF